VRSFFALLAVSLFGLTIAVARPASASANVNCDVNHLLGTFDATSLPGACWRPYADDSPFNLRVENDAPTIHDSDQTVNAVVSKAPAASIVAGDPGRPDGIAVFYSKPSDPTYKLHCTQDWGRCPIEGMHINIPRGAQPAGNMGTDAHLTVVDQHSGWEYDLWAVENTPAPGGTVRMGFGGRTMITGNGLGSYAVAARFGSLGGLIRPEELIAGKVHHALQMFVPCTEGWVFPADHPGYDCTENGMDAAHAPAMGAHFVLQMSSHAIRASHYPRWKRAVLFALKRYGAYVADTTADTSYWGFRTQSSASYTSFHREDPLVSLAKKKGMEPADYNHNGWDEFWYDLGAGVNWHRFEVVDACTAKGTC
jgi:hypothetical protein